MEMFDPTFWVALSFVIFIVLVAKPIGKVVGNSLDIRSERIREELDSALRLKEEAQAILAEYQRDQRSASEEVEEILENARAEAARMTKQAKQDLEEEIERRTELAEQKIMQAQATVIQELRDNAIDITTSAARALIMENLDQDSADAIIGDAIGDLGKKLH